MAKLMASPDVGLIDRGVQLRADDIDPVPAQRHLLDHQRGGRFRRSR
jgi:hypothetical protein